MVVTLKTRSGFICVLLCCFLSLFNGYHQTAFGGIEKVRMYDYWGHEVQGEGRPLLISTQPMAKKLFKDRLMIEPELSLGYLDYLGMFPGTFRIALKRTGTLEKVTSEALRSEKTTTAVLKMMEGDIPDFNGRVVLLQHGGSSVGRIGEGGKPVFAFELGEEKANAEDMFMVSRDAVTHGKAMANFFKEHNMKVTQIDLCTCCGEEMLPPFVEGLKAGGMTDVEVNAFSGVLNFAYSEECKCSRFGDYNLKTSPRTDAPYEYFVGGKVPPDLKSRTLTTRLGNPEPVPEVPTDLHAIEDKTGEGWCAL